MIDGTAASRSTIAANGLDNRTGEYWVRNTAIPIAIGTANTNAQIELSTVTMNKSRMPKARFFASVVSNRALVKKFAWFTRNDGTARSSKNTAISTIATTMVATPAPLLIGLHLNVSWRTLKPGVLTSSQFTNRSPI